MIAGVIAVLTPREQKQCAQKAGAGGLGFIISFTFTQGNYLRHNSDYQALAICLFFLKLLHRGFVLLLQIFQHGNVSPGFADNFDFLRQALNALFQVCGHRIKVSGVCHHRGLCRIHRIDKFNEFFDFADILAVSLSGIAVHGIPER